MLYDVVCISKEYSLPWSGKLRYMVCDVIAGCEPVYLCPKDLSVKVNQACHCAHQDPQGLSLCQCHPDQRRLGREFLRGHFSRGTCVKAHAFQVPNKSPFEAQYKRQSLLFIIRLNKLLFGKKLPKLEIKC